MKDFPIPVRPIGPGSQPLDEAGLDYVPIPRDVPTFSMPRIPDDADAANMRAARDLLARFVDGMAGGASKLDLAGFDAGGLEVLNQTLGEGEVAIRIADAAAPNGGDTIDVRIQETVFAGVGRERHVDGDGRLAHDYLQACGIPQIAIDAARRAASPTLPAVDMPPGAMNAPALLAEIREQVRRFRPHRAPHVINLTLLPLTPDDQRVLERAIAPGPVAILSRGFGNCRVSSTRLANLWRVQYFNSMQTLILNTIEVVTVPEVALAAAEDLADSRERLVELLDWMNEATA
ncbi:MAG: hydrogenase expression/formation protein [Burkholderiaceae bacterium]|nr:hydrogenase expression/formation protein [Burkholderiaceae bacterium]